MPRTRRQNPKVQVQPTGHVLLTGMTFEALRSTLTAADLWHAQALRDAGHPEACGCGDCAWRRDQMAAIRAALASLDPARTAPPDPPLATLSKGERRFRLARDAALVELEADRLP